MTSKTPRTDALMNPRGGHTGNLAGLCRELEREASTLRMALEHAIEHIQPDEQCAECKDINKLMRRLK